MNIKTADRLAELRRSRGLSQEELAEKLGVSRQAISKWERAESAPDTDNLIELAKIYGVTLDELLFGESQKNEKDEEKSIEEQSVQEEIENNSEKSESSDEKNDDDDRVNYFNILYPAFTIIVTIAYLLLGFFLPGGKGWSGYWFLFILIPVVGSIGTMIQTKRIAIFNYPCLATAIFCAVGSIAGVWHPTWVIFITIPVFYIIANAFDKNKLNSNNRHPKDNTVNK